MFAWATRRLELRRARSLISELVAAIGNADKTERVKEALVAIGPPAVDPLLEALAEPPDSNVGPQVAETLGRLGDGRAYEALMTAYRDYYKPAWAVQALGLLGDARAIEPIMKHFLAWQSSRVDARSRGGQRKASLSVRAVEMAAAAQALGRLRSVEAIEPLIQMLTDEHSDELDFAFWREMQTEVASALTNIGAPAVESLLPLLERQGDAVDFATEILGDIGDPRAFEPLTEVLARSRPGYSDSGGTAAIALVKIDPARAVEPLMSALTKKQVIPRLLASIGEPAVRPTVAWLKNKVAHEAEAGLKTIGLIGDSATEPLVAALEELIPLLSGTGRWGESAVAVALADVGDERAFQPLLGFLWAFLEDPRPEPPLEDAYAGLEELMCILLRRRGREAPIAALSKVQSLKPQPFQSHDSSFDSGSNEGGVDVQIREFDFSKMRELARKELERRGGRAPTPTASRS